MATSGPPPSRIRVVSYEGINKTEVKVMLEMIVDVHRLAEVGQQFLHTAIDHLDVSKDDPRS